MCLIADYMKLHKDNAGDKYCKDGRSEDQYELKHTPLTARNKGTDSGGGAGIYGLV